MDEREDGYEEAAPESRSGARRPRRFALAVLLNLLMPGLGLVWLGQLRRGVGVFFVVALAFATFGVVAWWTNLFLPRAAVIGAVAWLYVQVLLAIAARRPVGRRFAGGLPERFDHPLFYLGLLLALEVLPGWFLCRVAADRLLVCFTVADRNGFPELLPGDRVYGSRRAFTAEPPQPGTLVVVDGVLPDPTVLRVMAVPGEEVALEGGTVVVDGRARFREPAVGVLAREPVRAEVESIRAFREWVDRLSYEVYVPQDVEPQDVAPRRLGADEYFLLADLRDVEGVSDSRSVGPIPAANILGRPLWVWWSVAPDDGHVRWSRIGMEVR